MIRFAKKGALHVAIVLVALLFAATSAIAAVKKSGTPKKSTAPTASTTGTAALSAELRRDVEILAREEHNVEHYEALCAAATHVDKELRKAGYSVSTQEYDVDGRKCRNLIAELPGSGSATDIVIVGAHYDSAPGTAGANDNASGVASMLALARRFHGKPQARTVRFVAFVNEEPPYFHTSQMGSLVYATACKEKGEKIVGAISLETMGYFSDEKHSQQYPAPFSLLYPSTGNFIAFVGNVGSSALVGRCVKAFKPCGFPVESAALPAAVPGVGFSDQWSFWQKGYPGVMVTDTAPYRYPHYHTAQDTPDKVQYEKLALVTVGLEMVIREIAGKPK